MVAQFLRLKLTLIANAFRGDKRTSAGLIVAVVYSIALTIAAFVGLVMLRDATPEIAHAVVVVVGSALVAGFLLLPLALGVDDGLSPRRFSLYGIPTRQLLLGLTAAAFVGIPSLCVVVLGLGQVITWSRGPGATLLAVLSAVLIIITCVLGARVSSSLAALLLGARRARDASGIGIIALLAVTAPFLAFFATADWESRGLPVVRRLAAVLAWTPLGAAWSIPGAAALDNVTASLVQLLIAVAFVIALGFAWRWLVSVMLVTAGTESSVARYEGLGWFARMPATSTGAIAARSLSYWSRDARYRIALVVVPVVPALAVLALAVGGVPWSIIAWIPVPIMCLFLGWIGHNDLAHDSSAYWTHVSANTSGRADRWGRLVPALAIGIPLAIVGSVVTSAISGAWATLPALIGLSLCVLLVGLGISSVVSVTAPYPAVHPGDSPFAQPQAVGNSGERVQALSFVFAVVFAAPVIVLIVLAATSGVTDWYWAALAAGLAIGAIVLLGGVSIGARVMSRRAPELLAFSLRN